MENGFKKIKLSPKKFIYVQWKLETGEKKTFFERITLRAIGVDYLTKKQTKKQQQLL